MPRNRSTTHWPPRDAQEFVRSEAFARLIEQSALSVQRKYPSIEVIGSVGLVWAWIDRKAQEHPAFFSEPGRFPRPSALQAYVRQALWRSAANEFRKQRRQQLEPIPLSEEPGSMDSPSDAMEIEESLDLL